MDLAVLKKKISSYKTSTGRLTKVPDDLAIEILHAWEQWTGVANGFYTQIDVKARKMASVIGRAKKLKREGFYSEAEFKEVQLNAENGQIKEVNPCSGIEILWDNGKVIRFSQVDLLLDFLNKVA